MPRTRVGTVARAATLALAMTTACSPPSSPAPVPERRAHQAPDLPVPAHRVPARLEILRQGVPLHGRVRALTLLPGESVRLVNAAHTNPDTAAISPVVPLFEVRAHTSPTRRIRWEADGGTVATDSRGSAMVTRWVAPEIPGTYRLRLRDGHEDAAGMNPEIVMLVLTPFGVTRSGTVSGYVIGEYPDRERPLRHQPRQAPKPRRRDSPPVPGFVAVTPDNQDLALSANFRLRDFQCKQQPEHFPKYLALDVRLLDKLERLIDQLTAAGRRAPRVTIMSGFRTPHYNRAIGNDTPWSRHTLGDAADVYVDDDGDGVMDDLDRDGAVTLADADALLRMVDALDYDARLAGGAAAYAATAAHGPFVHIDVRGDHARW